MIGELLNGAASAMTTPSAPPPPPLPEFSDLVERSEWLRGRAGLESDVLRWHCERSGGGLTFADEFELAQCLSFLATAPDDAARLAKAGREYVLANYRWDIVLDTMEASLRDLQCASS